MPLAAPADAGKAARNASEGHFAFVDADAGTNGPEQFPSGGHSRPCALDVRDAAQSAGEHVSRAVDIEWRQVLPQRAKLPRDGTILVFCTASSFAAQAAMARRMDGIGNVRLPYGRDNGWKARGGMDAYARTIRKCRADDLSLRPVALIAALAGVVGAARAQPGPGPVEIDGWNTLAPVGNDPPGPRCDNSIQTAAASADTDRVPIGICPVSQLPPGTKAATVWYGRDNVAASAGKRGGMISCTEIADRLEIEDIANPDKTQL